MSRYVTLQDVETKEYYMLEVHTYDKQIKKIEGPFKDIETVRKAREVFKIWDAQDGELVKLLKKYRY